MTNKVNELVRCLESCLPDDNLCHLYTTQQCIRMESPLCYTADIGPIVVHLLGAHIGVWLLRLSLIGWVDFFTFRWVRMNWVKDVHLCVGHTLLKSWERRGGRRRYCSGARNFHLGVIAQGVWRRKSPIGAQGCSSLKVPRIWSSLHTSFTDSNCGNDQHWKISHSSPPDSWPVCFTVGGLNDMFGG